MPVLIDTPWTTLSDITKPDISAWQWAILAVAMVLLLAPVLLWKERWCNEWRWWQSVLFFAGWFCVALPVISVGAGEIVGDIHAEADAEKVVAQVLAAHPGTITRATAVVVEPTEHSTGSALDVPYQGDQIEYRIDYAAVTRLGDAVQCRAKMSLYRKQAPRGRSAPVFARISGICSRPGP